MGKLAGVVFSPKVTKLPENLGDDQKGSLRAQARSQRGAGPPVNLLPPLPPRQIVGPPVNSLLLLHTCQLTRSRC